MMMVKSAAKPERRIAIHDLKSIHARHTAIDEQQAIGMRRLGCLPQCGYRLLSVTDCRDLGIPRRQCFDQDLAVNGMIVDRQGPETVEIDRARQVGHLRAAFDAESYRAMKCAAFSHNAFGPNPSPHQLRQLLADRQAKPRTAVASGNRRIGLREALENRRQLVLRDTHTGVPDHKMNGARSSLCRVIRHFEDDGPLLRELDRIADEIDQNLVKAIWIAGQRAGDIGREMTRQFQPFLIRSHRENFDSFFDEIA